MTRLIDTPMKNRTHPVAWTMMVVALTAIQSLAQPTSEPYTFTTLAGGGGYSTNAVGNAARFRDPLTVAVDSAGNVYVAEQGNLARQAWEENNMGRLRQLLEQSQDSPDRSFEWYYWQRKTHSALNTLRGHVQGVNSLAFPPDGRRV